MKDTLKYPTDTRQVFKDCLTCSHTFGHLLNRAFGHTKEAEEMALDPLAGGIMNQGHQCGMLWGATLAVGAEAFRQQKDPKKALVAAITATRHLIESFKNNTNEVNCREIIGIDLSKTLGMIKFMIKTTLQGEKNNPCYKMAEEWAPKAIQSAMEGLSSAPKKLTQRPISCASEVVKKMGATEEEAMAVAGFAGGLGLSGNACGALSAALWMKTLIWCRANPGKVPPYFKNPQTKKILKNFLKATNGEMLCSKITGQRFETIDEHSAFMKNGRCKELMSVLAEA